MGDVIARLIEEGQALLGEGDEKSASVMADAKLEIESMQSQLKEAEEERDSLRWRSVADDGLPKYCQRRGMMDFGDYCVIEQKRYGADNELYIYKVIGTLHTNYYRPVPVDSANPEMKQGDVCTVVKAICCGVVEEEVETFRLEDVRARTPEDHFGRTV